MSYQLHIPEEPPGLLSEARACIEQFPADGIHRIENGEWIVDALWPVWCESLQQTGIDRDQFRHIVIGYQNEVRLWVMGERPWTHCVEGLIGRVERRMNR